MPWYPSVSVDLTDAQLWAIVSADPTVSNRQLAEELGAPKATVNAARWRLKRDGWACPVSYTTCRFCGRPLTRQGRRHEQRAYHPACRPVAVQELRKPRDRRR